VERDAIVTELIGHGYVNEERFARAFSRGHVRIKKWGWAKIEAHLKALHISAPNIEAAREEADAEATPDVLQGLILRKLHTLKDKNLPERDLRAKLYRYALSRGYSHQQATEAIQAAIQH
jgi:regulatory protein